MKRLLKDQEAERDQIIRSLWSILNEISHAVQVDDFTDEDLALWGKVTSHSAIQNRLKSK